MFALLRGFLCEGEPGAAGGSGSAGATGASGSTGPAGAKGDDPNNPPWLKPRLQSEAAKSAKATEQRIMSELGVDLPTAKAAIAAAKEAADAKKTAEQKAAELATQSQALAKSLAEKDAAIGAYAEEVMATLTDEQQQAVKDIAGDDAAAQLKTIKALRKTWKAEPAPEKKQGEKPETKTTKTAPAGGPPEAGGAPAAVDHTKVWEKLKKESPHRAAAYLNRFGAQIRIPQ